MSSEEQFPSLQKIPTGFQFYSIERIQEYCLDNQKVREAIIKCQFMMDETVKKILFEELGL